jgi:hypothetical protein
MQIGGADADGLATQLTLLVDGSIAQDLMRDDPSKARTAKNRDQGTPRYRIPMNSNMSNPARMLTNLTCCDKPSQ